MGNKEIPTAEEFFYSLKKIKIYGEYVLTEPVAIEALKEFAKMHVKAALKEASEKAECKLKESLVCTDKEKESGYKILKTNYHIVSDKDLILDAYSLDLIK